MREIPLFPIISLLILAAPPAASAAAERASYCDFYAKAAVNQVHTALADAVCIRNIPGERWAHDYDTHYKWCLTQPSQVVEAESAARSTYLRSCRGI